MIFKRKPKGRITRPRNGDVVPRRSCASGTIARLPEGNYLVLVLRVGGLMWPRGGAQAKGRSWTATVYEAGAAPGGRFAFSLYSVSRKGYGSMLAWLERGRLTDAYPGLQRIDGRVRLHGLKSRLMSSCGRMMS